MLDFERDSFLVPTEDGGHQAGGRFGSAQPAVPRLDGDPGTPGEHVVEMQRGLVRGRISDLHLQISVGARQRAAELGVGRHQIEQRAGGFYVPVEIRNDGDQTVEEVTVSIEVRDGETVTDEAETTIATLGESETLTAVLVLADDPAALTIDAGVVTFQIAED